MPSQSARKTPKSPFSHNLKWLGLSVAGMVVAGYIVTDTAAQVFGWESPLAQASEQVKEVVLAAADQVTVLLGLGPKEDVYQEAEIAYEYDEEEQEESAPADEDDYYSPEDEVEIDAALPLVLGEQTSSDAVQSLEPVGGKNLLRNSSFERSDGGAPRQWNYQLDSTSGNTFTSVEAIRSGDKSLKFKGEGNGNFGISQPDIKLRKRRAYTLSMYLKPVNAAATTVKLGFWDSVNNKRAVMKDFSVSGTKEWYRISMDIDNSGGWEGDKWFPMIEVMGLKSGTIYIDDVQLQEGTVLGVYRYGDGSGSSYQAGVSAIGDGSLLITNEGVIYPAVSGTGGVGSDSNTFESLYLKNASINKNGGLTVTGITSTGSVTVGNRLTFDNSEYIDNSTDDILQFVGAGGSDNTDLYLDLDGTYPVLYSNTDTKVGIDDDLEFVGAQTIRTSAGNLSINATGNLAIADTTLWTLAAAGYLQVDASTTANTTTAGVLDLNVAAGNAAVDGINLNFTINDGATAATDFEAFKLTLDADDADADVFGIVIATTDGAGVAGSYEAAISIDNVDATAGSMPDAILITSSGVAAGVTDAIDVSDAEITNAINVGANTILGTTGAIDYTNFDVDANGHITVQSAYGLDVNSAGELKLGDTTATTVSLGTTAATTINVGAGGALARAIDIGTGTGVDTINIGTGGTSADIIRIGDASADLALTDADWSITTGGALTVTSIVNSGTSDLQGDISDSGGALTVADDLTVTLGAAQLVTIDAATTDNTGTSGVIDLNVDTTTSQAGIDIDVETVTDAGIDTVSGIKITATQTSTDDDVLYGLQVANLGGTADAGNEYAIIVGTGWDLGLAIGGPTIGHSSTGLAVNGVSEFDSNVFFDAQADASGDGVVTKVNAGAVDDTVFTTDTDGLLAVDSTNGRFYFRYGAAWHYVAQTAGFQIPDWETDDLLDGQPLNVGDYLLGYVESPMSDGALHGRYVRWDKDALEQNVADLASSVEELKVTVQKTIDELTVTDAAVFEGTVSVVNLDVSGVVIIAGDVRVGGDLEIAGAVVSEFTAGQDLSAGDAVAISGENTVVKADKDDQVPAIGVAVNSAGNGSTVKVAISGKVGGYSDLAVGKRYYVGDVGIVQAGAPESGTKQVVGVAVSSDTLLVMPSLSYELKEVETTPPAEPALPASSPTPSPTPTPTPTPTSTPSPTPSPSPAATESASTE